MNISVFGVDSTRLDVGDVMDGGTKTKAGVAGVGIIAQAQMTSSSIG